MIQKSGLSTALCSQFDKSVTAGLLPSGRERKQTSDRVMAIHANKYPAIVPRNKIPGSWKFFRKIITAEIESIHA